MISAVNATATPVIDVKIVNPTTLYDPAPYGYSHVVVATGASRIAYIAGQGGEDAKGELSPHFDQQVQQAYRNIKLALDAIGAQPSQVTKLTTYVVDYEMDHLSVMTAALITLFGDHLPAQTLVPVPLNSAQRGCY